MAEEERDLYLALVNHEEQFSVWLNALPVPPGWTIAAGPVPHDECLAFIERTWTDMRPKSLRESMAT